MAYRTFAQQYAKYLDRPAGAPSFGPVGGPAAWTATDLLSRNDWCVELEADLLVDFNDALDCIVADNLDVRTLTREQIPLGPLAHQVRNWREQVADGCGMVVVRGWPVAEWGLERTELATWCLGLHLGDPGAQNPRGDLLGNVRNVVEASTANARLYQTDADIRFHCDYADAVGLMCVRQAPIGGESRVASSAAIHDELWRRAPELARRLYASVRLDTRDESMTPAIDVTPFAFDGERVRTFFHSDYFRSVSRHGEGFALDRQLVGALDLFDELANSDVFCVRMRLESGDFQLVSNHAVVHARSNFVDDPLAPRHLLRLWLSFDSIQEYN